MIRIVKVFVKTDLTETKIKENILRELHDINFEIENIEVF